MVKYADYDDSDGFIATVSGVNYEYEAGVLCLAGGKPIGVFVNADRAKCYLDAIDKGHLGEAERLKSE